MRITAAALLFRCWLCAAAMGFMACANRSAVRFEALSSSAREGEFSATIEAIKKRPKLYGDKNIFLYHMDLGLLHHYSGAFDSSNAHLHKAADILDGLYARSVTNEAASLLTNDNTRPYRSKPFERVLLHQFLAFNYLAMEQEHESLVETRRVQLVFDQWAKENDSNRYGEDGMFHYISSLAYEAVGERDNSLISLFKSVKAYKQGVVPLPAQVRDLAYYKLLKNDRKSDIDLLDIQTGTPEDKVPGMRGGSEIIVIGHLGRAPVLDETVFWGTYVRDGMLVFHYRNPNGDTVTEALPAPGLGRDEIEKAHQGRRTKSGTTFHIKFSMPALKPLPSDASYFTATHDAFPSPEKSAVLSQVDKLAEQALRDARNVTLIRTVIRVVLRTIASEKTKSQFAGGNPLLNLLMSISTDVLADQVEKADTRSCFLLPGSMQVIRLPVEPGKHKLEVVARGSDGKALSGKTFQDVEVKPGQKKFLFFTALK